MSIKLRDPGGLVVGVTVGAVVVEVRANVGLWVARTSSKRLFDPLLRGVWPLRGVSYPPMTTATGSLALFRWASRRLAVTVMPPAPVDFDTGPTALSDTLLMTKGPTRDFPPWGGSFPKSSACPSPGQTENQSHCETDNRMMSLNNSRRSGALYALVAGSLMASEISAQAPGAFS